MIEWSKTKTKEGHTTQNPFENQGESSVKRKKMVNHKMTQQKPNKLRKIYFSFPSSANFHVWICVYVFETWNISISSLKIEDEKKPRFCFWRICYDRGGDPQVLEKGNRKNSSKFQSFLEFVGWAEFEGGLSWNICEMRWEWVRMLLTCWIIYITTTRDSRLTLVYFVFP